MTVTLEELKLPDELQSDCLPLCAENFKKGYGANSHAPECPHAKRVVEAHERWMREQEEV